jgi:hypothetical protein
LNDDEIQAWNEHDVRNDGSNPARLQEPGSCLVFGFQYVDGDRRERLEPFFPQR